jgi:hypothetical protein
MTDPDSPTPPRVLILNISPGNINTRMAIGVVESITSGAAVNVVFASSGPYLDAGRNKAIAHSRRVTVEGIQDLPHDIPLAWDWLLFIDSDIEFRAEDIRTLLTPTLHPTYDPFMYPILSGVYVNPFDEGPVPGEDASPTNSYYGPVAYQWAERDDFPGALNGIRTPFLQRLSSRHLEIRQPVNEDWNPPGTVTTPSPVCEVDACGAGFLAIHHSLIDAMERVYPEPMVWFDEPVHKGVHCGEDFGFCIRVQEMGYPVLVNRACRVPHYKTTILI